MTGQSDSSVGSYHCCTALHQPYLSAADARPALSLFSDFSVHLKQDSNARSTSCLINSTHLLNSSPRLCLPITCSLKRTIPSATGRCRVQARLNLAGLICSPQTCRTDKREQGRRQERGKEEERRQSEGKR